MGLAARSVLAGGGHEAHDPAATVCEQFSAPKAFTQRHIAESAFFIVRAGGVWRAQMSRFGDLQPRRWPVGPHTATCSCSRLAATPGAGGSVSLLPAAGLLRDG